MSDLPKGWTQCDLASLGIHTKGSLRPAPGTLYELYSVPAFGTRKPEMLKGSQIRSHKRPVQPHDLLVCKINPRLNRVWAVGRRGEVPQIASLEWLVLRTQDEQLTLFLRWQLSAPDFRRWIERATHGVTGSHTRAQDDHVLSFHVRLAPLSEQRRITASIEEAFSKLDAGEAALHAVRRRCKHMRDAVLAAAVSGRLVPQDPTDKSAVRLLHDLKVDPEERTTTDQPPGWAQTRLGAVFKIAVGITPSRQDPSLWGGDISWVSSGEVAFNRIRTTRERITHKALGGRPSRILPPGTVMLAMIGEGRTRGQPAILDIAAAHNQNCASILVANTGISGDWVYLVLAARYERTRITGSGNNQSALNKRRVEAIELPVPPTNEQQRIVAEAERQFSFIEACERAVDEGLERSSALRRSILKAAFEGELVPQDPADEPASVLLERIRAERERDKPPKKSARSRR